MTGHLVRAVILVVAVLIIGLATTLYATGVVFH
jgi:hypothetical protein